VVIRFRVDGQLRDVMTVPKIAGPSLSSRLKIMAGLDIAERRRPQDGRARVTIGGENVDIRMSTLPALPGESIVMRLLPRARDLPPLARDRSPGRAARSSSCMRYASRRVSC
jgi:type IV pilus assembly protein PilB